MAYTPDKCLSELKKVIDKLREVKFKDIIKAEDDNLKIDALKWIYNTLYSMSDMFSYGDYLSKVSNLISKLKYVKDCPYDYEECLKHPEYFVYSDLHSNIIDTIINVKNALENLEPPCEEALDYINKLKDRVKWLWKPKTGFIVMSWLHNEIRSILKLIYDTLMIIFKKCYFPQCWDWKFDYYWIYGNNLNNACSRYSSGGMGKTTIIDKIASFQIDSLAPLSTPGYFNIGRFENKTIMNVVFPSIAFNYGTLYVLRGEKLETVYAELIYRLGPVTLAKLREVPKCDLIYTMNTTHGICIAVDENFEMLWYLTIDRTIYSLYSIDYDKDRKEEIIAYHRGAFPNAPHVFYLIDENGTLISQSNIIYANSIDSIPLIYDVDDDGNVEIILVCDNKVYCFRLPTFDKVWEVELDFVPENMNYMQIAYSKNPKRIYLPFFYLTNPDAYIGTYYLLSIMPNGEIEFTSPLDKNVPYYTYPCICICDFDGDGFEEILTYTSKHLWYYDVDKNTFYSLYEFTDEEFNNMEIPFLFFGFDVNNDGLPEVLGINGIYLWLIDPVAKLVDKIDLTQYNFTNPRIVGIGDLDNDGNGEILLLDEISGYFYLYSLFIYSPI